MKIIASLAVSLVLATTPGAFAQSSQQLLTEAQRAYIGGHVEIAKEKFQVVLQRDPENVTARNYLRMIATAEKAGGGTSPLQNELQSIVLEKIDLKDASFGSALEYLKQQVAKRTEGKTQVSFVVNLPAEFSQEQKVTLNLAGIPFTEALHYLCEMAGVEYKIEKYAVVIKKKAAAPATSAE